jgi:hypothetical protein
MIYAPSLLLLLLASAQTVQARVPSTDIDLADLDTNGIKALTVLGAAQDDRLGWSVSGAGDVNGDGFDDVIVAAHFFSPNDRHQAGAVYVLFGDVSGSPTVDTANFISSDSVGYVIWGAVAGDQNYFASGDSLGRSVSGAGDVNNDGYADVIIGAPTATRNGRDSAGMVYVIFGKASGFATLDLAEFISSDSTGYIINGAGPYGDTFGLSVSGAGDVNGDGFADVIVGAPFANRNGLYGAGVVYVFFGKAAGFATLDVLDLTSSSASVYIIQGREGVSHWPGLGNSVSGAGDVNNDGFDDVSYMLYVFCLLMLLSYYISVF